MAQLRAYCSDEELASYKALDPEIKEEVNKATRKFWVAQIKKKSR